MKEIPTENPRNDLSKNEAIDKLKDLVKKETTCLFTTNLNSLPLTTRPMATKEVDDEGNIWFMSHEESDKNFEIGDDSRVQLFYSNTSNYEFLSVYGTAVILKDRKKIEELWTPITRAWFTEGKDDPAITLIKVSPEDVYYWDTKYNKPITLLRITAQAITGKYKDDGIEGNLNV